MANDNEPIKPDSLPARNAGNEPEPKPLEPPRKRRARLAKEKRTGTKPGTDPGNGTPPDVKAGPAKIETQTPDSIDGINIRQERTGKQPAPPDFMLDAADKVLEEQAQTALSAAVVLIAILDGLAVMAWGDAAKMTPVESGMITPPLERILARLGPALNNQVSAWGDPIMLLMGLIAWGSRISRTNRLKETPPEPEPNPEPKPKPETMQNRPGNNAPPVDIGKATAAPDDIYKGFFGEVS